VHETLTIRHCVQVFKSTSRSLSLKLSHTRVYEPQIRARLGTTLMHETLTIRHGVQVFEGTSGIDAKNTKVQFTGEVTPHPTPYTRNPKPETLTPKPETRNPKPETLIV